jgi:hypothetical protein
LALQSEPVKPALLPISTPPAQWRGVMKTHRLNRDAVRRTDEVRPAAALTDDELKKVVGGSCPDHWWCFFYPSPRKIEGG